MKEKYTLIERIPIPSDKYTLQDLNELNPDLGERIFKIIERTQDYASMISAQSEVEELLKKENLTPQDIFVERGFAEGLTISEAYSNASRNYQFMDQLNM